MTSFPKDLASAIIDVEERDPFSLNRYCATGGKYISGRVKVKPDEARRLRIIRSYGNPVSYILFRYNLLRTLYVCFIKEAPQGDSSKNGN